MKVGHAIGRVEVVRMAHDIFRNYKQGFDDMVMEVACGLHNLRCLNREAAPPS